MQSFVRVGVDQRQTLFEGILYDDLKGALFLGEFQPSGALKVEFFATSRDAVDFANNRPGDELLIIPAIEAKLGRHVNLELEHTLQKLDVEGGKLFEANLSQARLVYNFNVRTFVRGIFQWVDVERNPDLYSFPVQPDVQTLFTQLLFSYQVNARTVLFVGYSDDHLGLMDVDLTQTNRTFFLKIGYAWIL